MLHISLTNYNSSKDCENAIKFFRQTESHFDQLGREMEELKMSLNEERLVAEKRAQIIEKLENQSRTESKTMLMWKEKGI